VRRAALVVALVLAACGGGGGGGTATARAEVGERAPTFVGPRLVGDGDVRLTEFRGKPVLLNFFASWCGPCRKELPLLEKAADEGKAAVVGVLFKDSASAARSFVREVGVTFPTVDDDGSIARAYRVDFKPGLPMTYAIDKDGVLVARHIGELRPQDIPDLIKKAS
jgi:cytochrome c biogenesis protein CcmG/thiol:disulfide interchange protein DsbE